MEPDVTLNETTPQGENFSSEKIPDENPAENVPDPITATVADVFAGFDPALHQADAEGRPILSASGTLKRKPGRPRKIREGENPAPQEPQKAPEAAARAPQSASEKKAIKVSSAELARQILQISTGFLASTIGPEWNFRDKEEQDGMHAALTEYLAAQGQTRLSPEMMLLLAVSGYAAPRFAQQNTRRFFGKVFDKIGAGFRRMIGRG